MRRSPGRRILGRLRKKRSWWWPVLRSRRSMRLEPRTAGGDWAISSSGRSKWKSVTRTLCHFSGAKRGEVCSRCGDIVAFRVAQMSAEKWDRVLDYFFEDSARLTEWLRMDWTADGSAGDGAAQATVTREKGLGMRKRSQERSCQARSGWT